MIQEDQGFVMQQSIGNMTTMEQKYSPLNITQIHVLVGIVVGVAHSLLLVGLLAQHPRLLHLSQCLLQTGELRACVDF